MSSAGEQVDGQMTQFFEHWHDRFACTAIETGWKADELRAEIDRLTEGTNP